ncbi:MAG: transposase [Cytophagales bacterium]|nr:transposase [Cytophagales bacterium]
MSVKYKIRDQDKLYFVTFSVVYWIDVFTREEYIQVLLDSIKYCQKEKGLEVYAWCIMTNHVHFIIGRKEIETEKVIGLETIVRDFKKYTSVFICRSIESNPQESRKEWILWMLKRAAEKSKKHQKYMFWNNDYHPIELSNANITKQKLDYLHNNPVKSGIVDEIWEYRYSSARDYCGKKGLLDIILIE